MQENRSAAIAQRRDRNLGRMLLKLERKFTDEVLQNMQQSGIQDLKMAHIPVLAHIETGGSRALDIAKATGISKQAVGKIIDALIGSGMLETLADPKDSRARILKFTDHGEEILEKALAITSQVEAAWAEKLGVPDLEGLKDQLAQLLGRP